jgi:hypothetical protein
MVDSLELGAAVLFWKKRKYVSQLWPRIEYGRILKGELVEAKTAKQQLTRDCFAFLDKRLERALEGNVEKDKKAA